MVFVLFILFHASIWHMYSKNIFLVDDYVYNGDLGRISFKADSIYARPSYLVEDVNDLPKQHVLYKNLKANETVDVITIGDSFSNGATQGKNTFYQDYIATHNNYKVLNILPGARVDIVGDLIKLNDSGLLDKLKPKIIIIESVERYCLGRFAIDIDFNIDVDKKQFFKRLNNQKNIFVMKDKTINFINNLNVKALISNIKFKIDKYKKYDTFTIAKLEKNFFTSKDKNSLLFYNEDLQNINSTTELKVIKLNDNINKLADIVAKKNIDLYFMPVVDKYNLYCDYIIDNPYPKSTFFELLRELPKKYKFIDTKKILKEEIENGVQDLYYSDDTHWSYKASEAVVKKVKFE